MADAFCLPEQPIRVNSRNEWLHGDDPIGPRVANLFARNVEVQRDGTYAVRLGGQRQAIEVADTPFVVTRVLWQSSAEPAGEHLVVHTSDGRVEPLDANTLMQSADNVLYCRVRRQGFLVPCRFAPQQYHALALTADSDHEGFFLPVGAGRYRLAPYDRRPHFVG